MLPWPFQIDLNSNIKINLNLFRAIKGNSKPFITGLPTNKEKGKDTYHCEPS